MTRRNRRWMSVMGGLLLSLVPALAGAAYENIAIVKDTGSNILSNPKAGALPMSNATKTFYATHSDDFDFVFVFQNLKSSASDSSYLPRGIPSQQGPSGTGAPVPAQGTSYFGSAGKLKAVGDMYAISNYTATPGENYLYYTVTDVFGSTPVKSGLSQTAVLGRAMMSYWGLYVNVDGFRQGNFYSFFSESYDSVLGGHHFNAQYPENEFAASANIGRKFGDLDLYLMGLKDKADVGKLFYATNVSDSSLSASNPPGTDGTYFTGTRNAVTMATIIGASGGEVAAVSSYSFRCAFVFVVGAGETASDTNLAKLESLRLAFQTWVASATNNKALMDCRLDTSVSEDGDTDEGCTQGEKRCNGQDIQMCDANHDWAYVSRCADTLSCIDGACVDPTDGDADTASECTNGNVRCSTTSDAGAPCTKDEDCTAGHCVKNVCVSSVIESCQSGKWTYDTDCWGNGYKVCDAGQCVARDLLDGDTDSATDGDDTSESGDGDSTSEVTSCKTVSDCNPGERCTTRGCLPCPDGYVVEENTCVDPNAKSGGGGGCQNTPSPVPFLFAAGLLFGLGMVVRRRWRASR